MAGNTSNRKKIQYQEEQALEKNYHQHKNNQKDNTKRKYKNHKKTNKIKVPMQKNKQHIVKKCRHQKVVIKVFTIMIFLFFTIYLCGYIWVFFK